MSDETAEAKHARIFPRLEGESKDAAIDRALKQYMANNNCSISVAYAHFAEKINER